MPISVTYTNQIRTQAANAESLTLAQSRTILAGLPPMSMQTLVAHGKDPAANGESLASWKSDFPTILGSLTDVEASFVIRMVMVMAGGDAV